MAREDQNYIIDLCDDVLQMKASREHTFDFLRGDISKKFPRGKKLPVDAFYASLNLVIEFEESHHSIPVTIFDKPNVLTISGINRAAQRIRYIDLRKAVLFQQKISLIFFAFNEFELKGKKLKRSTENDVQVIKKLIAHVLNK